MKTIKTWLTTIATLLCSITASAYNFKVDNIYYNILSTTEHTVKVTFGGDNFNSGRWYGGEIVIPSTVSYNGTTYHVSEIDAGAFYEASITSITIPEGVKIIGDNAFCGCSSLTSITIPESVINIGYAAFDGCSGITSPIIIPEGVTDIGHWAFRNCSSVTSFTIPKSVTSIGELAFSGCSGSLIVNCDIPYGAFGGSKFTTVSIGNNVTSIGEAAFSGCSTISSINIPESVTIIGVHAFSFCSGITSPIVIPEGVTTIGNYTFQDCSSVTSFTIPKTVTSIGYAAFYGCSSLTSITIPENVTHIASQAFYGCSSLTTIIMSENATFISEFEITAFDNCNIKKVIWKCGTLPNWYTRANGAINYTANSDYASYSRVKVYPMLGNMFEVDGITYVPTSMSERTCDIVDYDCNRTATSVNVGPTVTYKGVEFTVNNVNDYAFYGNKHLEEVTLANQGGVGAYAFANCTKLGSAHLAEDVTSVGNALFDGCNGLTAITVAEGNAKYDSRNNCNAIVETETNKLVAACNETVIPRSVTAIGDYAFSGCGEIASVTIHEGIQSIGDYAFTGCSSLADVVIEDRTEVLTLGSNGSKAMFSDCPLGSVYIGGKIAYNTSSSYGYSPFSNNVSLRTVTITDKEDTIYPYEFYNCSALTDVTIGDGVTTIGDYAFSGCTALERFAFGSSMKTIGTKAFLGCGKMTEVASSAVNPPVCGDNALDDLDKWSCTLYMPVGYKAAYQAADQWKEFLLMEDNIPIKLYTLTFIVDGNVYHTEQLAYNQTIVLPDAPQKEGYSFDGWEGLPETMPISDVTVNASFTLNEYTLTYTVDGEEYKSESVAYGTKLTVLAAPTKEGYTFSGWSELPETMPAEDVTIEGSFTVNNYMLTYIIDGSLYKEESIAYGTAIMMLEAPEKSGYTFDGWDKTIEVMPAEDVVIYGSYTRLPVENFVITDGSDNEFSLTEELECNKITYTRTLSKVNTWNALYVPFEIPVTAEFLENYDVAYFNDIHSYDEYIGEKEDGVSGQDGVIDRMDMEVLKVQEGATLNANYPYLIRAKNEEALNMTITVEDATLYETVETTVSCSSVFMRFDVTGIYTTQTAGELKGEFDVYAMSGGGWKQALSESQQLKPFRLYLNLSSIDGSPVKVAQSAMKAIRIRVDGEDETTEIDNSVIRMDDSEMIFDLQGRRVENPTKGIYIVNGKKVLY